MNFVKNANLPDIPWKLLKAEISENFGQQVALSKNLAKMLIYLTFPENYLKLKFRKISSAGGVKHKFGKNVNSPDIPWNLLKVELSEKFY